MEISWKYRSIKSEWFNNVKLELFEWSGECYVRLYGNSDNFVDIYVGKDKDFAESVYQAQIGVMVISGQVGDDY